MDYTDLSGTQRQQAYERPQDLTLSAAWLAARKTASSLVRGNHLYPNEMGLSQSGRNYGPAHLQGSGLAIIQHARGRLLRRGAERGHPPLWCAGYHKYGSGLAVHIIRVDGPAERVGTTFRRMEKAAASTTSSSIGSGGR
jgi:hypothetical protein